MDPQLQQDADSDDSSEERISFRHASVCACGSPDPRSRVTGHVRPLGQHNFSQKPSFLHKLAYEHNAKIRAELA